MTANIQSDPVITKLLDKVPAGMRGSFSGNQLPARNMALGVRDCAADVQGLLQNA